MMTNSLLLPKSKQVKWIIIISLIIFGTLPLYFFQSGGFQHVDVLIILLSAIILTSLNNNEIKLGIYLVGPFIPYIGWTVIVNSYSSMIFISKTQYLLSSIQILYVFYLMFLFSITFYRILMINKGTFFVYMFLATSCITPWLLYSKEESMRQTLSFNNPNQLGYFSILILFILMLINHISDSRGIKTKIQSIANVAILSSTNVFAILSASRATLASIAILDAYFVFVIFRRHSNFLKSIITLFLVITGLFIFITAKETSFEAYLNEGPMERLSKKKFIDMSDLAHRSIGQMSFESDLQMIFGQGGGRWKADMVPIEDMYRAEVHNSVLGIMNNYGVIGIMLLAGGTISFVIRLGSFPQKWILILPILVYNMSHYGLRFRLLWIALALFAVVAIIHCDKAADADTSQHSTT